jgi:solute carrier family 40 (iron-regulated transporter), member 1
VITNGATLLFSPAIGRWVDRNASRFYTIKITIVVQRVCVVLGCLLWILLFVSPLAGVRASTLDTLVDPSVAGLDKLISKHTVIAVIILFCAVERMCAVGNNLVMERDWVPTIASEVSDPPLHRLNATMRRIDLFSKILAPVFVSVVAIRTGPAVLALVTAVFNLVTVAVELLAAKSAWDTCYVLKVAREAKSPSGRPLLTQEQRNQEDAGDETDYDVRERPASKMSGLRLYFSNDAWLGTSPRCSPFCFVYY